MAVPGQKGKCPYRFLLKSEEPFAFAGIWNETKGEDGSEPRCAIITTEPNTLVRKVHDRMPAILSPEAEAEWLNLDTPPEQALELLQPYPDNEMKGYGVSMLVNSPSNDMPEVLLPI